MAEGFYADVLSEDLTDRENAKLSGASSPEPPSMRLAIQHFLKRPAPVPHARTDGGRGAGGGEGRFPDRAFAIRVAEAKKVVEATKKGKNLLDGMSPLTRRAEGPRRRGRHGSCHCVRIKCLPSKGVMLR